MSIYEWRDLVIRDSEMDQSQIVWGTQDLKFYHST